ncbi:MAG: translocation/assembly module TamB domain-containing protein [Candidatus Krumholzibacteriia bacterium]
MWRRTARRTLLLAWLLFLAVVAFLVTHPRLVAPLAARLVSRNLFRDRAGTVRVRDFRGNPFHGLELYQVSFTLAEGAGGAIAATVDTLVLDYRWQELLAPVPRLRRVEARGAMVHATTTSVRGQRRPPGRGPLPVLPRVSIDDFRLGGGIEVAGVDGRLRERLRDLRLRGAYTGGGRAHLGLRYGRVDWETRESRIDSLRLDARVTDGALNVADAHLLLDGSPVDGSGGRARDGEIEVAVRARDITPAAVSNLLNTQLGFRARGDATAHVQVRADSVRFSGAFDGELEGYRMEGVRGSALLAGGFLVWDRLTGRINGASFDGAGRFDVRNRLGPEFWLAGEVADVDLSQKLVPGVVLPRSGGHGRLAIHRRDTVDETDVQGALADGFIADVPFDSCLVAVHAARGVANLDRIELRYRALRAVLTGVADTSGVFAGELTADSSDLSQLPAAWGLRSLTGSLAGRGRVSGRDPAYDFTGSVDLRAAGLAPLRVDSCRADLAIRDVVRAPQTTVALRGSGLSLGGVPLGDFTANGSASGTAAELASFRAVRGDSVVTLRGRALLADSADVFTVDELGIDLKGTRWALEAPVSFVNAPRGARLGEFRLASTLGSLRASGGFERAADRLYGGCELRRFDLRLLNPFVPQAGGKLNGAATAEVTLEGGLATPELSAVADLTGSTFRLARIDSLHVEARYARHVASIDQLDLRTQYGRAVAHGTLTNPTASRAADFWPDAALDLTFGVSDADWAFIDQFKLPALARIAGRFGGDFRLTGTPRSPVVDGQVDSAPFNVHWLHLQRLRGRIGMTASGLVLSELDAVQGALRASGRIELPLRADLLSTPVSPPDGPFLMAIEIPDGTDLAPLTQATNAFAESGGRGGMSMRVEGPAAHPLFSGWARVRGGRCVLKGLAEVYNNVEADGVWAGDLLTLTGIRGAEGARGTFTGEGQLRFHGLLLEGFDIRLDADRCLVASIPDLRALVRGRDVHVTGVKVGPDSLMVPKFTGQLEILLARYTGDFAEKPTVSDPRLATVAPDWLADLHLVGPPRTTLISNRAMELALSGDVDVVRDLDGLYVSGSMNIDTGRMPVFNNDFRVVTGRLDFNRTTGSVPNVDIQAETTVRLRYEGLYGSRTLERITARVTGSMDAPKLELSSESGYNRAAIERLLLGLSPNAAETPAAGGLRDASIAAGFNLLEREIAAELKIVDTFDIESAQAQDTGVTRRLIGVGKYLGQDLYVKYAQGLSESERDLLIEYQMSDHVLLQSEISRRLDVQQGDTTYNLDLKYRFEY